MGSVADDSVRGVVLLRYGTGIVSVLACAATAGPAPPGAAASEPRLKIEESPSSRVLYFEESGGLITPAYKPPPRSLREPLPLFPALTTKALPPGPPVANARKARLAKAPAALKTVNASVRASVGKYDGDLRLDQAIDTDTLVARLVTTREMQAVPARGVEDAAGPVIVSHENAQAALQLGWLLLEAKEPANAAIWFQRARAWRVGDEEATRGFALATLAARNYTTALAIADELPAHSPLRADVRRDAWVAIGQREYDAARYRDAIAAFDRANIGGDLPRYVRLLRAWSRLRAGDVAAAADFAVLYREHPDIESAQGVVAAVSTGSLPVDLAAAAGPLGSLARARQGEAAYQSRRYLEARALDPSRYSDLGSPGVISAFAIVGRRERTGEGGLGKLTSDFVPGLDISLPVGEHAAISLLTDRVLLDAGKRVSDAPIGTAPAGRVLALTQYPIRTTIRESSLSLRMERTITIVASAGNGVRGGHVAARPVGSVGVSASPTWGQAEVRGFVEPVRESILSWSGMVDPHSASAWGGVRRRGVEARALYLGAAPYSAAIQMRAERLAGTGVAGNDRRSLDVSAGRDLGLPGFAYSSLGLALSVDAYGRNLSRYTVGHGGYFSPQSQRKLGVAFDFMTEEGRPWLVRGRMATALAWKREDAAPFFPLEPDGRVYESARSKGHDASIRVSGVAQLSPRIQAGLALGRGTSPQFGDKFLLLEVRVLLEPRRGVVSADLPPVKGE